MARKALKVLMADEMRLRLINDVDGYPSDSAAAKAFGVTRGHLSRVLRGLKPVDGAIAHALGYERQDCYVPYEERDRSSLSPTTTPGRDARRQ